MGENKFVLCFNAMEKRFFEVIAIHLVEEPYRKNYYRLCLRLNFFDGDIDLNHTDAIRRLCLRKVTNLMTSHNMWQDHHSFYVIEYEVRLVARKNNDLIQQNHDEKSDESTDNESMSTVSVNSSLNDEDSAYGASSPSFESSTDTINENLRYWTDESGESIDSGGNSMSSIEDNWISRTKIIWHVIYS